ncbi:group II intron maturase-specific domain-containing protein [Pelagicoccus sp. SDUM812002]|uniref:group II intron maturase-specific domain-containing protein n=1 Tax=Pelagicoccus sp. SDUM812002 TaxID=3041266 RepID=UPI0034E2F48C
MEVRLSKLRSYCVGWFHYFKPGLLFKDTRAWDGWIRRRVRLCYWKMWKLPRMRRRMLLGLGVEPSAVKLASRSRKGYWRLSMNSLVRYALSNSWLEKQGVPSLYKLLIFFRNGVQANA